MKMASKERKKGQQDVLDIIIREGEELERKIKEECGLEKHPKEFNIFNGLITKIKEKLNENK